MTIPTEKLKQAAQPQNQSMLYVLCKRYSLQARYLILISLVEPMASMIGVSDIQGTNTRFKESRITSLRSICGHI